MKLCEGLNPDKRREFNEKLWSRRKAHIDKHGTKSWNPKEHGDEVLKEMMHLKVAKSETLQDIFGEGRYEIWNQ